MKKIFILVLLYALLICSSTITNANERWYEVSFNDIFQVYFDTQSFQKSENNGYYVWVKWQYTEAYGKELSKKFKFKNPISHVLRRVELDFVDKRYRFLSDTYYDIKGKVPYSNHEHGDWKSITPESTIEIIFHTTYNYYKDKT